MTKEEKRIYNQEYKKTHKDEIKAKQREYREKHKDEINAKQREYYARRNKEVTRKQKEKRSRMNQEDNISEMKEDFSETYINETKNLSSKKNKFTKIDDLKFEQMSEDLTVEDNYDRYLLNNFGIHRYFSEKNRRTIWFCE